MEEREIADANDMRMDFEAVIRKYPELSVYTTIGCLQALQANLLDKLNAR